MSKNVKTTRSTGKKATSSATPTRKTASTSIPSASTRMSFGDNSNTYVSRPVAFSVGRPLAFAEQQKVMNDTTTVTATHLRKWQKIISSVELSNGIASAVTQLISDFIIGEGLKIVADDPTVESILKDEHWYDEMNDWTQAQYVRARDIGLNGEIALRLYIPEKSQAEGYIVQVSEIPPCDIMDYRVHKKFKHKVAFIKVRDDDNPSGVWLQNVRSTSKGTYDLGKPIGQPTDKVGNQKVMGYCIYETVNRKNGNALGRPDLLPIVDQLDSLDNLVANVSDRANFMNSHVYHVKVAGDKTAVEEVESKMGPRPTPGTNLVTGDGVTIAGIAPTLATGDQEGVAKMIESLIFAGSRIPITWLGRGESANKASAQEMSNPTVKWLIARQGLFVRFVEKILQIQLQVCHEFKVITTAQFKSKWALVAPSVITIDPTEAFEILYKTILLLSQALLDNIIDLPTAIELFKRTADRVGIELPDIDAMTDTITQDDKEGAPDRALMSIYTRAIASAKVSSKTSVQ